MIRIVLNELNDISLKKTILAPKFKFKFINYRRNFLLI
jgi:hypothetical protein